MVQKSAVKGRPRGFDPDRVLVQVRDTFWRYGYAGTSMDQLASATGLHKPSLYGAFGDKKRLYLRSLDQYLDQVRGEIGEALVRPKLMDSLRGLVDVGIGLFSRTGGAGCFMMSTAVPEAGEDTEISEIVRRAMDSLDRALVHRFEKAAADGEIPADCDMEMLARIMVSSHYDLSARARAGYPVDQLKAHGERTLDLIGRLTQRPG